MGDALTTRLVVYRPGGGDPVARLWPTSWSASFVHNDPADSAMSLEVATQVPGEHLDRGASWLLTDAEVAVEINGGSPTTTWDGFREVPNGRFLVVQESHDGVQPTGTAVRATLVPFAWLLTKAHVGPGPSGGTKPPDPGKRRFVGTVGAILRQLIDEAQNQGLLETVRCNVWGNVDSRNHPWPATTLSLIWDIGTDYLTIIRQFVSAGYCDVSTQGTELVFQVPNSDSQRGDAIVLNTGSELLSVPRERDTSNVAHSMLILGDGGSASYAAPTNAANQSGPWGKWEMVGHFTGTKASQLTGKARSVLNFYTTGRTTVSTTLSLDPAASLPFRHYGLGGWVQVATQDGNAEVFQVASIALAQPQTGPLAGSLELGRRKIIPEKKLAHAVATLSGGAGVAGLATPGITRPPDSSQSTSGWLTDWTPVWTTTGGGQAVGAGGALVGRYWIDGTRCDVDMELTTGTGTTFGSGGWSFSLPADARLGAPDQALQMWIRTASGSYFLGIATIETATTALLRAAGSDSIGRLSAVTATVPATFGTSGDKIRVFGTYELAVDSA